MRLSSLSPSSAISPQSTNFALQLSQPTALNLNPSIPDRFQRQNNVSFTGQKEQDSANQRLYRAIKDGEIFTARNLMNPDIRDHADVNGLLRNKQKEYQYSLLTRSVEKGDQNAIRLLKQLGVDPEQRDGMGRTPLTYAAELGKADIIDLLIDELGADLTKTNAPGYNPLTMASLQGHAEAIQHLLDRPKAKELDLANTTDDLGWTPLTVAARMNHTGVIETLHKHGVNLKKSTVQGLTALKTAKKYNHTQTVQLLEKLIHEGKTDLPQNDEAKINEKAPEPENNQHIIEESESRNHQDSERHATNGSSIDLPAQDNSVRSELLADTGAPEADSSPVFEAPGDNHPRQPESLSQLGYNELLSDTGAIEADSNPVFEMDATQHPDLPVHFEPDGFSLSDYQQQTPVKKKKTLLNIFSHSDANGEPSKPKSKIFSRWSWKKGS